jgi:hypothetical protein
MWSLLGPIFPYNSGSRERERQQGIRDKILFKCMPPVTYFFQPGPNSYNFPIMPSNCDYINESIH